MATRVYDSREWRTLRANWRVILASGARVNCFRCGTPIRAGERWALDHTVALALGGDPLTAHPSHERCNSAHGASIGNARRGAAAYPGRRRMRPAYTPAVTEATPASLPELAPEAEVSMIW